MVAPARLLGAVLSACALSLLGPGAAAAAPADLDGRFGRDGIAQVAAPGGSALGSEASARMAIGPRGEVLVLYSDHLPCDPPFDCVVELGVARFDVDGDRDGSFGVGPGSRLVVRQFTERHAFDLAVGPDGRAVVVASDHAAKGVTVARFGLDGRLDATFGIGGIAAQPVEVQTDTPVAVAVQPDGRIVVAGEGSRVDGGQELVLARYLPSGAPDPGFGSGGEAVVILPTRTRPADLLLDATGGLSVPAPLCCVGGSGPYGEGFGLARLLTDGGADPELAKTGQLFFPTPGYRGEVEAAALAPDGGVILSFEEDTGTVATPGNVMKVSRQGSLDTGFGGDGMLWLHQRVGVVGAAGLVVDRRGRLVGTGRGDDGRISLFRLRADGSVDRTFNGGRQVTAPLGVAPLAVALQQNGRIVALGITSHQGPRRFLLIGLRGGTDRTRCQGRRATIVGTRRRDELVGTRRRDVIAALAGNDTVRGLSGADLICGGLGRDHLLGGPGRDSVEQQPVRGRGR